MSSRTILSNLNSNTHTNILTLSSEVDDYVHFTFEDLGITTNNCKPHHEWAEIANSKKWLKYPNCGFRDQVKYLRTFDNYPIHNLDNQLKTWENIDIPENKDTCKINLKFLIRKGIPDVCRSLIWTIISEVSEHKKQNQNFYQNALKRVFGSRIPNTVFHIPTFGGIFLPADHFLNKFGENAVGRILCVLAMENPQIEYLPLLPDFACILLHFLSESDSYTALQIFINHAKNGEAYFTTTKKGISKWLFTFDDLIKSQVPNIADKMKSLGINAHDFADGWFLRLYVSTFPYQTVLRIFDCFLNEGSKILFRIAVGFLKLISPELLECKTTVDFLRQLEASAQHLYDPDPLMKVAFGIRMTRHQLHKYNQKNSRKVAHIVEPKFPVYYRPKITQHSNILIDQQFEIIWSWLPTWCRIKDPILIFNTSVDGYSFTTLLKACNEKAPTIMIIKTNKKDIFGAFVTAPWKIQKDYFGDRDCFVWKMKPRAEKWNWIEGCTDLFMHLSQTELQVGGGAGTAISIDNELWKGRTETCTTFLNPPLTHDGKEKFETVAIEIFGFA